MMENYSRVLMFADISDRVMEAGEEMNKGRKMVVVGLIVTVVHLIITLASTAMSYSLDMDAFDKGLSTVSTWSQILAGISEIFLMPLGIIWTSWLQRFLPSFIEPALVVLNSALWGFSIALLWENIWGKQKE
jgi:hypothetical protein